MRSKMSPPRKEEGQAVVFAVILLLAVVVGIGVLYNTGRLTLDKTRLQNTADSAAYSSGVLLARSYNFSAYANRAMVANQVVIAQMVGLRSWSQYYCLAYNDSCTAKSTYESVNDLPGQIGPLVESVMPYDVLWPMYQGISESAFIPADVEETIAVQSNEIIQSLSILSKTYHEGVEADLAAASAGGGIVHTIIKANYPHLSSADRPYVGLVGKGIWLDGLAKINAYTTLYGSSRPNHMAMFATLVKNNLDQWTKNRMSSGGLTTSEIPPYPMANVQGFLGLFECEPTSWISMWVNYKGTTQWQWEGSNPNWSASDSANIYGFNLYPVPDPAVVIGGPPCIPSPPVPIFATSPSIYFWSTLLSKASAEYGKTTSHHFLTGYGGLKSYEDVSSANLSTTATPVLSLDLVRQHNTIATTQNIGVDQGAGKVGIGSTNQLDLPSKEAHGEMAALASVQVHFVRPGGASHQRLLGGDVEYGTLFNPYWQAHLVPNPSATRQIAQVGQEGGG